MAKFKFPVSELNECWWLDTTDCVMAGYTFDVIGCLLSARKIVWMLLNP